MERWRLFNDARAEIQKFPNEVTVEEYGERVKKACEFLEGQVDEWSEQVTEDMKKASAEREL
jgi:excinuclease UvrABC nuclease subunit